MRSAVLSLVIAAVAVAAAWRGVAAARDGRGSMTTPPSPVIYPAQRLPLTFSHARHARLDQVTCATCHRDTATSRSAVDNLMPTEAVCAGCHPIDRSQPERVVAGQPPARCDACHPGWRPGLPFARVHVPPPNLKFGHASHRDVDCRTCHGDLAGVDLATRDDLPKMSVCLDCHDDRRAAAACTTCHLAGIAGRVRTEFPEGPLAPSGSLAGDAHDTDFRTNHAAVARAEAGYCAGCHAESFCADCHAGAIKPLDFHGGNYLLIHAVEARRGSPDCSACHRRQSFCVGCHERSGVARRISDVPLLRFHPEGWASGGIGNHGVEARRNVNACAACHRDDFCVQCHTAEPTGMRISPHPPGWAGSARCDAMVKRARRMCLRCHIGEDEARCDR